MKKPVAREVLRAAFRSGRELEALLAILKTECPAEEHKDYARAVAGAIGGIGAALTAKVLAGHPDLADEIEANLNLCGRAM